MIGTELISASQLAQKLQVTRRTVYRLIDEDRIPKMRVGGKWRFDLDEVLKHLDSHPTSRNPASRDQDATPTGE